MQFKLVSTLFLRLLALPAATALWPRPQAYLCGDVPLTLAPNFAIKQSRPTDTLDRPDLGLMAAVKRAQSQLDSDRHRRLSVDRGEDRFAVSRAHALQRLEIVLTVPSASPVSAELEKAYEDFDEAYELSLPHESPTGKIALLSANTTIGILRGLETFTQLVYYLPPLGKDDRTSYRYIRNTSVYVYDEPAFPHRALMLDTSRHFFPVPDIIRVLEAMASVKLNVFHWHATDSQSWPLFVDVFPDLGDIAPDQEGFYGIEEVKEIVATAGELGISVMLEIDMPGHSASLAREFPNFIACYDAQPWSKYAVEPPAGQLKLGDLEVLDFAQSLLKSVSSNFPSRYLSTGGDEINDACYEQDPSTSSNLATTNSSINDLLLEFVDGTHTTLRQVGKIPVVWEELVLGRDLALKNDTIVLNWISSDNVRAVVDRGYRIIHAASDYFYLDCGMGGWLGKKPDGNSWCDPFKTWSKIYSFDPYDKLDSDQYHRVLGGEALAWSEQIDANNLDSVVWPRAAAAAEVFWSGGSVANGTRDVGEALPRLHDWRYRAVNRGVRAAPLQPHWCALRPGSCDA